MSDRPGFEPQQLPRGSLVCRLRDIGLGHRSRARFAGPAPECALERSPRIPGRGIRLLEDRRGLRRCSRLRRRSRDQRHWVSVSISFFLSAKAKSGLEDSLLRRKPTGAYGSIQFPSIKSSLIAISPSFCPLVSFI